MIIKNLKDLFEIVNRDIKLNYSSTAEFARKVGRTKQAFYDVFNAWKNNKEKNSVNVACDILNKAGYEIKIEKKIISEKEEEI